MTYSGQTFASPQEALEHHGIKGMRWGIRKESDSGSNSSSKPALSTKKKVAIGIGVATVAVGAAAAAHILSSRGSTSVAVAAVSTTKKLGEAWVPVHSGDQWAGTYVKMVR